jgi:hypothetical protein
MGRFYQTAKPQFIEDMIYQPPWELMKEALGAEQDRYDVAVAKADMFNHVDVNYIDDPVERQKVADKQAYYAERADALTQKFQSATGNDWAKSMPELNKLRRELEQDYKTGDIHKIQESADQYAKMEEHLKTIKDPVMKQKAKESFMSQWQANPNRSIDKTFSYNDIYDKKDVTGEFLDEWTKENKFPPNVISSAFAKTNGRYINSGKKDIEIREGAAKAYEQFVQAKGYEPYLKQEEQFGLGKYFDNGKLMPFTDPRSSGYEQANYVGLSDYRKESKADADLKEDAYGLAALDFRNKMYLAQYAASKAKDAPISATRDASFYYKYTPEGKAVVVEYNKKKGQLAQALGAKSPAEYDKYIDVVRNNPEKYPTQFKYLTTLDNTLNVNQRSGTDYMKNLGLSQDQLDIVDDKFSAKGVEQTLQRKSGYLDFGLTESGKHTMYGKGTAQGKKMNINSLVGTVMPGTNDKIATVEMVEGTVSYMPGTESDGTSGVGVTVRLTTESGKEIYPEFYISGDPLNIGF